MASSASDIARAYPQAGQALSEKIVEVSGRLGIPDPGWLANLINFESAGTFSPAETNSFGYTGLIQFGTAAASDLGTTTTALRGMSAIAQMDYVERYLNMWKSKGFSNPTDLYMAVFYPESIGNPDYQFPAKVVAANNGISNPREYTERANKNAKLPTGMSGTEIGNTGVRVLPKLMFGSLALLGFALIWRRFQK
jgi:hypothetical protein